MGASRCSQVRPGATEKSTWCGEVACRPRDSLTLKVAPGPPGPWRCVASLFAGRVATTLGDGLSLLVGREVPYGRDALPTPPKS